MFGRLLSLTSVLFRRRRFEQDMTDEMRFHLETYTDDLVQAGVPRDEAARRARLEFGGMESMKEESRAARGLRLFDELRQDVRFAVRQMARAPGLTIAAVASLALGIGANTAIFSLMEAVMFRTLPLVEPSRLYFLGHTDGGRASMSSNYPLFERYKTAPVFDGVTAYVRQEFTIATPDGIERANGQWVSGNYHALLGAPIAYGRGFSYEIDRSAGSSMIAVISEGYWSRQYGRSHDVLGKQLVIDGQTVSIVGVTAAGFDGLVPGYKVDITLPLSVRGIRNPEYFDGRVDWTSLSLVGRIKHDVGFAQARAVVDAIFTRYWMEPENAWARGGNAGARRSAALLAAGRGSDELRRPFADPLRILMAMVGLVLIIACVNVANLLLARGAARAMEVAVRISIGAGRSRLIRQFLTESVLVACVGGAIGLVIALVSAKFIVALFAMGRNPVLVDVGVSVPILVFALVVSVATGIGFGLAPALRATRINVAPTLKAVDTTRSGRGVMTALMVTQIALCALVISAAGLFTRTLSNLRTVDAGFDRQNVLLFNLELPRSLSSQAREQVYDNLQRRLRSLPGVGGVAYSLRSPADHSTNVRKIEVPGSPADAAGGVSATIATPEYFDLFGIRLLRGRHLAASDRPTSEPVAVIDDAMANRFFGAGDPIGRTILLGADKERLTIVGVVDGVRETLRDSPVPTVYTPLVQMPESDGGISWHVTVEMRASGDLSALTSSIRREVRAVNRDASLSYVRTMDQQLDASLMRERLLASVSAGFGLLAVLLAAVGLYGLMSYGVTRRGREIGLRIALGATPTGMSWQIVRQTMTLAATGIVIGLSAALGVTRVMSTFLFGLSPRDPATFSTTAIVLFGIAFAAGYVPSRRAAAVDPMRALRSE